MTRTTLFTPSKLSTDPATTASTMDELPGRELLRAVRRLVVVAGLVALAYSFVTVASRGYCPGGFTGDGGYLDAQGDPTDAVPQCLNLTMNASPFVLLAIGALVFVAIGVVQRHAVDLPHALRMFRRYTIAIAIVAGASALIGHVWFWLLPLNDWTGDGYSFVFPFPFASVDVNVSPADSPDDA
ncbi:hypothetical protein GCM10027515_32610 [Schumannella luteola]|uniref:Putative metal-binding membrane protein n=1 Tax=Schumannella luteola TaxID=472059 RepID=A0A852YMH5_9MICO|nr:hypothetical protein [Schumannella luteola]NYG98939.1 putative metal-binding membrane protein [Schumannella luteola]TPX06313.1 hypothetical protein FJ656_01340 [Schumannella luteola]